MDVYELDQKENGIRGGTRGGLEQFRWDPIKDQKSHERAQYLGVTTKLGVVGKFGKFYRHDWWAHKNDPNIPEADLSEADQVRLRENELFDLALKPMQAIEEKKDENIKTEPGQNHASSYPQAMLSTEEHKRESQLWRLREDPLYEIKKQEMEAKSRILNQTALRNQTKRPEELSRLKKEQTNDGDDGSFPRKYNHEHDDKRHSYSRRYDERGFGFSQDQRNELNYHRRASDHRTIRVKEEYERRGVEDGNDDRRRDMRRDTGAAGRERGKYDERRSHEDDERRYKSRRLLSPRGKRRYVDDFSPSHRGGNDDVVDEYSRRRPSDYDSHYAVRGGRERRHDMRERSRD